MTEEELLKDNEGVDPKKLEVGSTTVSYTHLDVYKRQPIPMCIVNNQGKVTRANGKIADVFKYDGIVDADIFEMCIRDRCNGLSRDINT